MKEKRLPFTVKIQLTGKWRIQEICEIFSPIYTAENFWRGLDESGTRTKKIVMITHLHVLFSTVLNDVKL